MELRNICNYKNDRVSFEELSIDNYVSTDNMLPNKGGVCNSSFLPHNGNAIKYNKGDILISNIRPYFKKIWYADKEGGCSADVLCIKAKENVDTKYLYYLLSQQEFFDYVMAGCKGCKMPRGDKQHIMQWDIQIPKSNIEQKRIANILSAIDDKISINNRINHNLKPSQYYLTIQSAA